MQIQMNEEINQLEYELEQALVGNNEPEEKRPESLMREAKIRGNKNISLTTMGLRRKVNAKNSEIGSPLTLNFR